MSKYIAFLAILALSACNQERIQVGVAQPPERFLTCKELPAKPDLAPLTVITMPDGTRVYLKSDTDTRDGAIARYIVGVRDAYFSCRDQLSNVRDYVAEVE